MSNNENNSQKDVFTDYTFSGNEWTAKKYTHPDIAREDIDALNLCGRKIKSIRFIGLSYMLTRDWIVEYAYNDLFNNPRNMSPEDIEYDTIPEDMDFQRHSEMDEPMLIEFEDQDVFEIEAIDDYRFRFSMNKIPYWIDAGTNAPNVDANILFSPCIGRTIVGVEINTVKADEDHYIYGEEHDVLIQDIVLRLDNGLGLRVQASFDYSDVDCIDAEGHGVYIKFAELKPALFNWEDKHTDPVTGFESNSYTLYFGEHKADTPYMSFHSSGNKDAVLTITACGDDFMLLDWCITHETDEWFDEYTDYHFTSEEWWRILDEADEILAIDDFDVLFDKLVAWNILYRTKENCMLSKLNLFGAKFWATKDKYRVQIKDLRKWTALVLGDKDTMDIYGF